MGLHRVNGSPVHDQRARLSADVQPSRQDAINPRKKQSAQLGIQAFYYLSRYRLDIRAGHGREREAHCSAAIANSHPALDQVAAEPVTDLIGMDCLLIRRCKIIGHNVKASGRSFWGDSYARLLEIKHAYDPDDISTAHHGVGSQTTGH